VYYVVGGIHALMVGMHVGRVCVIGLVLLGALLGVVSDVVRLLSVLGLGLGGYGRERDFSE
jgi:hypothetical protein